MEKFSYGLQAVRRFAELYGKKTFRQFVRYNELIRRFRRNFHTSFCYIASSSGRIELVGNHTDHNGGKVVGCTVDSDIVAAFLPNDSSTVHMEGDGYHDIDFDLSQIGVVESGSIGMVKGVLAALSERGYKIGGFSAMLNSTLPAGAGMSSSAAFQLLVASIQNHLYNDGQISPQTLAEAGQYAENVYFEKPCGLLDQGVVAVGGIVEIDFRNGFESRRIQNNLPSLNFVVVNTGKSHSSLTEHYAAIPAEMKQVAGFFGKTRLIDVDENEFLQRRDEVSKATSERAVLRAKHFFEENLRVARAAEALSDGDKDKLLRVLNESGDSSMTQLQNCNVGDDRTVADAVEFARSICPECASRVHGGGFQGTILAVVDTKELSRFCEAMAERYGKENVIVAHTRSCGSTVL